MEPYREDSWYINADRSMWAIAPDWRATVMWKMLWIRPAKTDLKVAAERLDGPTASIDSHIPCCYGTGFQVSSITFPAPGCWKVTATAGAHTLQFVARVKPR